MKRIVLILTAFVLSLFAVETAPKDTTSTVNENVKVYLEKKDEKLNKIVAKVDGIVIRQHQVDAQVAARLQKTFYHKNISKEKQAEYNKDALEDLINKELLYAYAKRNKIFVDKKILEERKQKIVERFKSKEEFLAKLKESNLLEKDLEKEIDMEESMKIIYEKKIKLSLTDEDLKQYYEKNKHKFLRPEAKKMQIITVNIDPSVEDGIKKARVKANEAYEKVGNGEFFEDVATKYSEDMYRIKGGNLGFVHKGTYEHIDKVAFSLEDGEVSKLMQDDIAFYFVKILESKKEEQFSFEKMKAKLKKDLKVKREKSNLLKLLDEQKKLMKVEIL